MLQGVPIRYDIIWSPRWPTKVDFQVQKKVAAHSGDRDIWVLSIFFQKSNVGWPQQPPTEKVTIFNLIFYDSINISFIWNIKIKWNFSLNYWIQVLWRPQWWFSRPQIPLQPHWPRQPQQPQWPQRPPKPFFLKKLPDLDDCNPPGTKMTKTDPFLWIGTSKI